MMNGVASSGLTCAKFQMDNQMYLAEMLSKHMQLIYSFKN